MALTAPFVPDNLPVIVNGVITPGILPQALTQFGFQTESAANSFSLSYQNEVLTFKQGIAFAVDAVEQAALRAVSAGVDTGIFGSFNFTLATQSAMFLNFF